MVHQLVSMDSTGGSESMFHSLDGQHIGTHRRACGNTDNRAAEHVNDKRGVAKSWKGANISNLGNPQPTEGLGTKVSLNQVQAMIRYLRADRGYRITPTSAAGNTC